MWDLRSIRTRTEAGTREYLTGKVPTGPSKKPRGRFDHVVAAVFVVAILAGVLAKLLA